MNRRIPFEQSELRVIDTLPGFFGGPGLPLRNTPVTPRENMAALYFDKHPYWLPLPGDATFMMSPLYNEQLGRGGPAGVTDAFGITWEWVESAGGSIVRPGEPFMKDANEWKDKIVFPDIDAWDWEGETEKVKCDCRVSTQLSLVNGFWFERLVSFMDFAPAAMALIDDDQKDAVKALFAAMTDFACRIVDKYCEYWPALDGFNVHDDWAAQRAPFFSEETARELFLPFMKQLTDHIHSKGRYATLHSCGHGEDRVWCFVDGGFDGWDPQIMNNTQKLWTDVGDKICISVVPETYDAAATSAEEQRRRGMAFAEKFAVPGKMAQLGFYGGPALTPAFNEGVYIKSREIYGR